MEFRIPPFLKKNDAIAIVSPSGKINTAYINETEIRLKSWGLQVKEGTFARNSYFNYAGTASERIHDLQKAINDPEIKAVLCSRGGYGLIKIIDQIDFSALNSSPKWIIGFSDVTVLHNALFKQKIASIHGIMCKHIAESGDNDIPLKLLKEILLENKFPDYEIAPHVLNRTGETSGRITGGNLSVIYGLRNTPYDLLPDKTILFIEDLNEHAYHIDRMMANLKLSGVLSRISGLIVGQFSEIKEIDSFGKNPYEIIKEAVNDYDYPVLFDFPAGHVEDNRPLVLGATINLSVSPNKATVRFSL